MPYGKGPIKTGKLRPPNPGPKPGDPMLSERPVPELGINPKPVKRKPVQPGRPEPRVLMENMAVVRRQKGDKTKVNANGVLVITRANGNVIKVNGPKGTITRLKADGTVVKQKLTSPKANNFTSGQITKIRSQNVKKTPTKRGGR